MDVLDNRVSGIVYTSPSSIAGRAGSPVVNLVGLEVTQGVQNWMGTLELVRNKQTAVRAFFETPTAGREVEVAATLRAHTTAGVDMGSEMPVNSSGSVTVSDDVAERRWQLNSSLNFVLELDWSNLGENDNLILSLDFADNITVNCRERIVPARSCSANVSFLNVPAPDIVMVPLETDDDSGPPDRDDLLEQFARINSLMPFATEEELEVLDVEQFNTADYAFDIEPVARDADPEVIIETLLDIRSELNDGARYLGVMLGRTGSRAVGAAEVTSHQAAYWFTSGVDGGSEANAYFGRARNRGAHDMSYCEPFREDHEPQDNSGAPDNQGRWMDAFHHERIIDERRRESAGAAVGSGGDAGKVPSDMFSGIVEFSDAGVASGVDINDVFSRPRHRATPMPGDYVLELRDASGGVVRSASFAASRLVYDLEPGSGPLPEPSDAVFSFVVSEPPEYSSFAIKHDDSEVLVVNRSASAPSVSVSGPAAGQFFGAGSDISVSWSGSDADGDELSYRVYYSVDGGTTYAPLSLGTDSTSKIYPASKLEGTTQARIGVSVSDGARSSFAETPVFSVANHAPEISIRTPVSGDVFAENQGFVVEAVAYDMEDGLLPSSSIVWESSVDGSLGAGRYLVLSAADLTAGSHTLTVTATDAAGLSASASVDIVISLRNALPVANDDIFQVSADEEVLVDVLANDVDVEGDVDLPSFRIVQTPGLGFAQKVRTQEGVRIKYYSNTSGRDNFSYIICDAVARCDTARVSIDVGLADCTILGTEADDTLEGTSGDDVICGLGGDDTIDAKGGDDVIRGGLGDDTIYARAGNDVIYGEIGNDLILGHNGADTIYGGLDDDTIYGGGGADAIFGGHGQDRLYGEADDDTIEGGGGADTIHGGRGDDTIRGGDGDDTIRGNAGADTIEPGKGTDTLLGTSPEDTIKQTA